MHIIFFLVHLEVPFALGYTMGNSSPYLLNITTLGEDLKVTNHQPTEVLVSGWTIVIYDPIDPFSLFPTWRGKWLLVSHMKTVIEWEE